MPLLAHAFGKRYELPIPLWLFVIGGGAVVLVSFLFVMRREVLVRNDHATEATGRVTTTSRLAGLIVFLLFAYLLYAGWFGSQEIAENILPTFFWLLIWVAVPVSCGFLGNWTSRVNVFRLAANIGDRPRLREILSGAAHPVAWPSGLAYWPSAILFFIAACGELVFNATATQPAFTASALAIYFALCVLGGFVFGADIWVARAEMFSVLFDTWGRLGFFRFGSPGKRGFCRGLVADFTPHPSRIVFVLLLLTSVSFDGVLTTSAWQQWHATLPGAFSAGSTEYQLIELASFIVLVVLVWLLFGSFALAVRHFGHLTATRTTVFAGLLASILPISFGYLVAHNAEYLAINGQLLIPLLGDPTGLHGAATPFTGQWLPAPFNDDYTVNFNLVPSSLVWYLDVAVIVGVHIIAVVLAHDFACRSSRSSETARRSEYPWIVAMVGYTMSSLWLLAQPLIQETSNAFVRVHAVLATLFTR